MKNCRLQLTSWALLACFLFTSGEPIKFRYCDSEGESNCKISNVVIDPCPDAIKDDPCKVKRGKTASLSFNFTPQWAPGSGELRTQAFWATTFLDLLYFGMQGMDTNVCKYSKCPLVKDVQNSYNFTFEIPKNFAAQRYDIKFIIWEEEAEERVEDHECCVLFPFILV